MALILCPNVALVQQVLATIRSLQDSEGRPLLAAAQVSSSVPPPFDTPDVVVTTPGGLCTLLREAGRHYGSLWSAEGLAKRVSHVVVDEADLLTTGGYAKDLDWILEVGAGSCLCVLGCCCAVRAATTAAGAAVLTSHSSRYSASSVNYASKQRAQLLIVSISSVPIISSCPHAQHCACVQTMRLGDRRNVEAQVMAQLGMSEEQFARVPRYLKQACWEGGLPAMVQAGYNPPRPSGSAGGDGASTSGREDEEEVQYWARQYIFVAATMPATTKGDVGTDLKYRCEAALASCLTAAGADACIARCADACATREMADVALQHVLCELCAVLQVQYQRACCSVLPGLTSACSALRLRYPDAVWLSGELLHKSKPQISHTWRPVDAATWGRTLLAAVKEDTHYAAGNGRTLVFAKDVASADRVASVLSRDGVNVVVYHKSVSVEDRAKALEHIASADNAVMVSTDAAARGIDIPDVQHVVQADFATNAVDFLHRIGRTARAGREGKVTSLYMPENATLAEVLQRYIEAGEPIEGAFSRNRSFSKKVKEYGKFVPRGEAGRS